MIMITIITIIGNNSRMAVTSNVSLPVNWNEFLLEMCVLRNKPGVKLSFHCLLGNISTRIGIFKRK